MAQKRVWALVHGYVQGVGFRYYTQDIARELGVYGWVRNTSGGNVEVIAEGEEGRLARLVGMLREGPMRADVTGVDVEWQEPTGEFQSFYVRR